MRAKKPESPPLYQAARTAGESERRARDAVVIHPAQNGQPVKFETLDDVRRQLALMDLIDLDWLLEEIQATPTRPVTINRPNGMTQGDRLKKFCCEYAPVPGHPAPEEVSQQQIDDLLGKAKAYIQRFIIDYEPIEIPIAGRQRIDWHPSKKTWLSPDNPPKTRFVDANTIAPLPAAFCIRLAELLIRYGHLIRACTNCRRLFIKKKRQEYCSKTCSQTVRNAKARSAPDWQERQHSYYEERKKQKALQAAGAVQNK
jgi:hypothetical protein